METMPTMKFMSCKITSQSCSFNFESKVLAEVRVSKEEKDCFHSKMNVVVKDRN